MKQSEKKIKKEDTQHLTTEWYNQNQELYRTYLQSLSIRLRNQPNDKSEVKSLIQKYLKAEEKLLQVAITDKYPTIPPKETYLKEMSAANKQIDANQKQIFELHKDISTKAQQKQLLVKVLKINIQNYQKVLETYSHTITQPDNSYDRENQKYITFEVPNLNSNLNLETITKITEDAKNAYNQADSHKLQGGLGRLQLEKENLVREVCQVVEKEALPQEMHPLYHQKEQTLQSIKAIQCQISKYNSQVENQQRYYDQASLKNKNLREEINRLKLRTVDELLLFEIFEQEASVQPPSEDDQPQHFDEESDQSTNKRIIFQQKPPHIAHKFLVYWALLIFVIWLMVVIV